MSSIFSLRAVGEVGKALLDFVYPPACMACGKTVGEAGEYLCGDCWREITRLAPVRCPRCGCPLAGEEERCCNCAAWETVFERAVVLGPFGGAMQQAIHALKFKHHRELGTEMGRRMGQALREVLAPVERLVPVPLHPARQRERGYNQSEFIARGLAQVLGVGVDSGVVKRRINTRQQARLGAGQRQENLRGAFRCCRALPPVGCIGLVDDVLTTGATFDACARALVDGGAQQVWAVALASPFREPVG